MRVENLIPTLAMPPDKCILPHECALSGTVSFVHWKLLEWLKPKDRLWKFKMLSHFHRQLYFASRLIDIDHTCQIPRQLSEREGRL